MKNERFYQNYLYSKYKNKSMIIKENKIDLAIECDKFNVNYTDIYVKIINFQIYTYGTQLSDNYQSPYTKEDIRKVNGTMSHRKRYRRDKLYLNRVAVEKYKTI